MRAVASLLLLACDTAESRVTHSPATMPTFVDASANLPLSAAPCAALHDFDGDGRAELVFAPIGEHDRVTSIARATWQGDRFAVVEMPLPIADVSACAVSPMGKVAIAAQVGSDQGAVFVDGVMLPIAEPWPAHPNAVAWFDERLAIGLESGADAQDLRLDDDGRLHCTRSHPPSDLLLWDGRMVARIPLPIHDVNRLDVATWDGHRILFVSADCGVSAILDEQLAPIPLPAEMRAVSAAMGVASLFVAGESALCVADTGSDWLFVGGADRAGAWGVTAATRWHSGWSPRTADFNGDGKDDVLVARSVVEPTIDDLRGTLTRASQERASDLVLVQGEGAFYAVPLPHRERGGDFARCAADVGDVDGDGRADVFIACRSFGRGDLRLYLNQTP